MKELNLVKTDSELKAIIEATYQEFENDVLADKFNRGESFDDLSTPAETYEYIMKDMIKTRPFLASLFNHTDLVEQFSRVGFEAPRMNY